MMVSTKRFALCILASLFTMIGCSEDEVSPVSPQPECDESLPCTTPGDACVNGKCVPSNNNNNDNNNNNNDKKDPTEPAEPTYDGSKPDQDGDGIPDEYDSCDEDFDNDTIPNCLDDDSDGDGIPDSIEKGKQALNGEPVSSNYMGTYDFLSTDSDLNGIPDNLECVWGQDAKQSQTLGLNCTDTDGNGIYDFADPDNDGDGISDIIEIKGSFNFSDSQFASADCDMDGVPDPIGTTTAPFVCVGAPAFLNPDSDGDTIPDGIEGSSDSNNDGYADVYSQDSDSDGLPDSEERCEYGETCTLQSPVKKCTGRQYAFQSKDCDMDGIIDKAEVYCANLGKHSGSSDDVDGDGYSDASELYVADAMGLPLTELMCDPNKGVKDIFDFYFELPYKGDNKNDTLLFTPAVSKLDVIFNMDVTQSMGEEVAAIQSKIGSFLIPEIRNRVSDAAIGVSAFADFPVGTYGSWEPVMVEASDGTEVCYTQDQSGAIIQIKCKQVPADIVWELYTSPSTDPAEVQAGVNKYQLHYGDDAPEATYEALWMIAKADDTTQQTASYKITDSSGNITNMWETLKHVTHASDRWGGAGFRQNTLPVVVHITDTLAHDKDSNIHYIQMPANKDIIPYDENLVKNYHGHADVHAAYQKAGIRVLSINRNEDSGSRQGQLQETSFSTNAVVPICAFKNADGSWKCGENKCCLETSITGKPTGVSPNGNQCILSYGIRSASTMNDTIIDGIDALVKYGTYEVSTIVRGYPIEGKNYGTECFLKKVEAYNYIAPAAEPEKSCNPTATPYHVNSDDYKDGFNNFAPGTSTVGKEGAKLEFLITAQNDSCVEAKESAQVFYAEIDVINPTTGLVFDTKKVSIIVPGTLYSDDIVY